MDIESIKTFMVLAHTKNYTRAANQLFVAQSTVTNRIHELESRVRLKCNSYGLRTYNIIYLWQT